MPILLPLLLVQSPPAVLPAAPIPPWAVQTRTNPDLTVRAVFAATRSRDGKARLVVRCDRVADPVVSVQLSLSTQPLAADTDHAVTVVIDNAKPIAAAWQFPGGAAVMSEPETVTELTVALERARSITVSTTAGGAPVVASFDGPDGGPAVRAVLAACDYTFGTVPEPIKPKAK